VVSSPKGKIFRLLSSALLTQTTVVEAVEAGGFRRLRLPAGLGVGGAGDKLQLLLPSDDTRTYTPIPSAEGPMLLGWLGAGGPGAAWFGAVAPGDPVLFLGPQRSLVVPPGPVVIVGDETSVAVAAAFAAERPGAGAALIEAGDLGGTRAAAASVGLGPIEVFGREQTAAVVAAVGARLAAMPGATVALTGGAARIVSVRAALTAAGLPRAQTKTYWIAGRRGID